MKLYSLDSWALQLRSDPAHQKSYHQLELFAYGTLDTHRCECHSSLPARLLMFL